MGEVTISGEEKPKTSLNKFLGAAEMEPATMNLRVKSLDGELITIRELNVREISKLIEMESSKHFDKMNYVAEVVAMGLVHPDIHSADSLELLRQKFGDGVALSEVVATIFKPMELPSIADKIMEISGGGEDSIQEAKN